MKFPPSEHLGRARDPEGRSFVLRFYGESEGAAVIVGPARTSMSFERVPEVHREPAEDAADARGKLIAWIERNGWGIE